MSSGAVSAILLGFVVFLICSRFASRPKNLPPGPWSIPIIGYRAGSGLLHECYSSLARRYGPIFSLRRGPYLVVVLNNKDTMRNAFVKNADVFSDRYVPRQMLWGIPSSNKNASVVWSSGKPWVDLRRFGLTSLRAFGMGKKSLEPKINDEARFLCEEIQKMKGAPQNLFHHLNLATSNVICQLVLGRRFEYTDEEFKKILDGIFANLTAFWRSDVVTVFPILLYLPRYKSFWNNFYRNREFMKKHLELHSISFDEDNIRDIIDAYLDDPISADFTLDEIWRVMLDYFVAGTETTSTVLSWAILYLAHYPGIQRKVQDELDTEVGRGRQPTVSDRQLLPYCEATLMEIMRIRPAVPVSLPHMTSREVSLEGYTIPKGCIIIPNIWAAHHDPEEWNDPEAFDPERFLEYQETSTKPTVKKNSAWMPFGVGNELTFQDALLECR